jgi:hypothetical protein
MQHCCVMQTAIPSVAGYAALLCRKEKATRQTRSVSEWRFSPQRSKQSNAKQCTAKKCKAKQSKATQRNAKEYKSHS